MTCGATSGRGDDGAPCVGTISDCVASSSILQQALTERVGWTVGAAILVLVVVGRVKPVRGKRPLHRRAWEKLPGVRPRVVPPLVVEHQPTALYHRTSWWRRLLALIGGSLISIVMGAMLALVIGAGAIWAVSSLTSRLR